MSNHVEECPADLRILKFKYATLVEVPAGVSPAMALQSYNTAKLNSGALAVVYGYYSGTGETGPALLYVFKRNYAGATFAPISGAAVPPTAGGGVWILQEQGALAELAAGNSGGAVTLTAAAAAADLVTFAERQNSSTTDLWVRYEARVLLVGNATPGGVVTLTMDADSYDVSGAPTWANVTTQAITLALISQQTQVTIVGHLHVTNPFYRFRVQGAAVTQTCTVTNTITDIMVMRSSLGYVR